MTLVRLLRIVGFATAFFVAFTVSQAATAARNAGETVPGIHYAIGALSLFFLTGAYATEVSHDPLTPDQGDDFMNGGFPDPDGAGTNVDRCSGGTGFDTATNCKGIQGGFENELPFP